MQIWAIICYKAVQCIRRRTLISLIFRSRGLILRLRGCLTKVYSFAGYNLWYDAWNKFHQSKCKETWYVGCPAWHSYNSKQLSKNVTHQWTLLLCREIYTAFFPHTKDNWMRAWVKVFSQTYFHSASCTAFSFSVCLVFTAINQIFKKGAYPLGPSAWDKRFSLSSWSSGCLRWLLQIEHN